MQTALDKLLNAARSNPDLGPEYIDLFLNTEVFVPVWNELPENPDDGTELNIQPVTAKNGNEEFLLAFDTKERVDSYVEQAGGVAQVNGIDVLMMVSDQPVQVCLNAGTEFTKVFSREEIEWILENAQAT